LKIVAALTLLFVLGLPFAHWKQMTYDMLVQDWMKTLIIFFLITQTMFTQDRVRKLLYIIILCELLVCTWSMFDARSIRIEERGGRVRGATVGFLSGNYLGIAAAITLPYIAVFLMRSRSLVRSLGLISTFGVMMLLVVKTASRSNMICVLIALVLVYWKVLRFNARGRIMGAAFSLAIVLAVVSAPGVFWERITTIWDSETYATSTDARSAKESEFQRRALFRRSIQYTLERPLLGLGLGNFAIRSGGEFGATNWKGTHNTYMQVASEAGIPAFLLFLALLWTTTKRMRSISKAPGEDAAVVELRQMSQATLISLYGFMLSGFFAHLAYDFYLYYLIGISVSLQAVHQRFLKQGRIVAVASNGRRQNGALKKQSA